MRNDVGGSKSYLHSAKYVIFILPCSKLKRPIPTTILQHSLHVEKAGDSFGINDLLPLGRPSHCSAMLSSFSSVLHSIDSPSPCQSFCCLTSIFHNSGDENDQTSQDTLKAKFDEQKHVTTDFSGTN